MSDFHGQSETDFSGVKIACVLLLLGSPVSILCGSLLLPQFIWAIALETLYACLGSKRNWVSLLVACCTVTTLFYIGLTQYAAQNIRTFVQQGSMAEYPLMVRVIAGPVFRGLLEGISLPHIFLYCATWGIPLGAFLWFIWRFVVLKRFLGRRQKWGSDPRKAQEGDSAAPESQE
jgi:hypothetical protein